MAEGGGFITNKYEWVKQLASRERWEIRFVKNRYCKKR